MQSEVMSDAPIAVTYVRVSSPAQVKRGQGAESQAAYCANYAEQQGYNVVRVFKEKAVTGSITDRPAMKELLAYVRQHRKKQPRVIIDDISRLARNLRVHLSLRVAIEAAGGLLESPALKFGSDSDSQLVEHLLAAVAAHGRDKNIEQVRARMKGRFLNGYYPFNPPLGLVHEKRHRTGNILVRDEPVASIIQEALEGFATGRFASQMEVARFLSSQEAFPKGASGKVYQTRVDRLMATKLYAGLIEYQPWGIELRKGAHDGLISIETYEAIQERLQGKRYAVARADINADFPLRGAVCCADCDKPLTANWSKSKTGKKHPYYLCFTKGCPSSRKSIRRADIETAFDEFLEGLTPQQNMFDLVKVMFEHQWQQQTERMKAGQIVLRDKAKKITKDTAALVDRILSTESQTVIEAYEKKVEALESEKRLIELKLESKGKTQGTFREMFELAFGFLSNPSNLWKNGTIAHKKTVLRMVLDGPLTWKRNEGFRTPQTSSVFSRFGMMCEQTSQVAERKSV